MKKNEIVILILMIAVMAAAAAAIKICQKDDVNVCVQVALNGDILYTFSINENVEKHIETPDGYNVLVIENGYVYISEADCHDLICIHHGRIDTPGDTIICLPHRLSVQIVNSTD